MSDENRNQFPFVEFNSKQNRVENHGDVMGASNIKAPQPMPVISSEQPEQSDK